ncbi:MAG: NADP-dependent malic enzyme [Clostridia bacterium]|jgi:malate dehydrogenase (oxaloacetate-decarboxylating)|nr:NADP-dependent malic enzyme [Clostridia bacterium]
MDLNKVALEKHAEWRGKLSIESKATITNKGELSIAYTPGVAAPCLEIEKDEDLAYVYTGKGNTVAVITDGTAVLGLGDIGPSAAMPVMEGKCALFKTFAGVDAVPILIDSKDPDEIVKTVQLISKSFGGINLEDISAPRCFEIEQRLVETCDIPVFHDDQHGTAIIATAGILNAIKVSGRTPGDLRVVINGAGAAGISIAKMLMRFHIGDIILVDINGTVYEGAPSNNPEQEKMAKITNKDNLKGDLAEAMKGADIFIGVSKPNLVTQDMVRSMAKDPIVFAMANPVPEIMPDLAKEAGAYVVGTGRSDFPNQVNNVMAFPGIFRGALDCRAKRITEDMKEAAARAIAEAVPDDELSPEYVLPDGFNPIVVKRVAAAVRDAWEKGEGAK